MKEYKFYLDDDRWLRVTPNEVNPNDDLLALSIQKWEAIVGFLQEGGWVDHDGGMSTCGLCAKYHQQRETCKGCPVREVTGWPGCVGTPYEVWDMIQRRTDTKPTAADLNVKLLVAERELAFLKSLEEEVK